MASRGFTVNKSIKDLQILKERVHLKILCPIASQLTDQDILLELMDIVDALNSPEIEYLEWSVDDVFKVAAEQKLKISKEKAIELLHDVVKGHDANYGISWINIETALEQGDYETEPATDEELKLLYPDLCY